MVIQRHVKDGNKWQRPNGLEMSRPASAAILHETRFAAAGRDGSIELLGSALLSW